MIAASGYEIRKAIQHPLAGAMPERWDLVLLGFVVSAVFSFFAVKWLLRYVQTHTFTAFGWYRIALASGVFLLLLCGGIPGR
jgi:undecaprenyl-diphosphatase